MFYSPAQVKVIYKNIHDAVRHGDVEEMEMMVKQGASINEVDDHDKFTPVHWACHVGALEVIISTVTFSQACCNKMDHLTDLKFSVTGIV